MNGLTAALKSKKLWGAILGSVAVVVMDQMGLPAELQLKVAALFGVQVGGQALADLGKSKAAIVAEATNGKAPAEKAAALEALK